MYFVKTPWYLKTVYPSLIWDMKKSGTLYLTFDDGPIPIVTEKVLEILNDFHAKATFFVIGENVKKYPNIFQQVIEKGHAVGNHTMHHLNGWNTENELYVKDVKDCNQIIQSKLFRPPYGRIGFHQIQELKKEYEIYMWNILSGDFDATIDAEQCYKNVVDHAEDGDIIVFHDSIKAQEKVLQCLPKILTYFSSKGFQFKSL